ncbi:hypothetical protein CVM73_03590 [Bradyrhizobium forestalis]|uniref:Uncharacterized protein n=1 Tax=Bradyrhizobium forestalis TaxID=1419263 RepID=A0A2M8RFR7_9BRAD|nr:hypothetical protein CVM73_03590 [Bradyrhizobium forestalis]
MSHVIPPVIVAIVASSCLLALAQAGGANAGSAGAGMGTGPGSAGGSAPSGMGTSAGNAGPSAPPGMGTKDTAIGGNLGTNNEPINPNVQPATPARSRAAAQAARNAGVGHAQNGLPIGAIGSGTSNEDQMATGSAASQNRFRPAAQAQGNTGAGSESLSGRGSSLSDQISQPRAARAGDKVLDAKAQVDRRTNVSPRRVPSPIGPGL